MRRGVRNGSRISSRRNSSSNPISPRLNRCCRAKRSTVRSSPSLRTMESNSNCSAARSVDPAFTAVVISRKPTADNAVAALRLGVVEYLTETSTAADSQPLGIDEAQLAEAVERMLKCAASGPKTTCSAGRSNGRIVFDDMIGTCPAMPKCSTHRASGRLGVDCLVHGETGTGKELVARSIHTRSQGRRSRSCRSIAVRFPRTCSRASSSATSAGPTPAPTRREIGLLEFADGGTFFLDELGELPLLLQAKLLRTLQERRIRRVGGRAEIPVDCANRRRDGPQPRANGRRRQVSSRPLLSHQRRADRTAAAPQPRRRSRLAGRTLRREVQPRNGPHDSRHLARGVSGDVAISPGRATCASCKT